MHFIRMAPVPHVKEVCGKEGYYFFKLMKRKVRTIKRIFTFLLVFLISINSFAAVVSDNDGSAFITKAEFDSLKNSFQSQIDSYNMSIDSKIDGAIASYLAGIRVSQPEMESDSWIYSLQWYNKLPTVAYNSSYCTSSTNPHRELRKTYSAGKYANQHDWIAVADDSRGSMNHQLLYVVYAPPNSNAIIPSWYDASTYNVSYPNGDTDDTFTSKDNATYSWTDNNGKKVFQYLDYYNYYYWNINDMQGNNNVTSNYSASDTCPYTSNDPTEWPKWYFEFDAKGYPCFTCTHWYWRGTKTTSSTGNVNKFSPRLALQNSRQIYGGYSTFMLGKADTSTHASNPVKTTEYVDGLFDVDIMKVKIVVTKKSDGSIYTSYEHDDTHPITLSTYTYVYPTYMSIPNTDTTTTKLTDTRTRYYKAYEWDSTRDKTVYIKGFRPKVLAVCDWYNATSMDYEPLMLYEGAPVMQALPATGMYKVTIKTSGSAQVNLMKGKFGRTTTGNGNTLIRYNENGTENGYAQNMACNTTLTFYIKGEKGKKYYCRINPTSTGTNSSVKITSFKYQQVG